MRLSGSKILVSLMLLAAFAFGLLPRATRANQDSFQAVLDPGPQGGFTKIAPELEEIIRSSEHNPNEDVRVIIETRDGASNAGATGLNVKRRLDGGYVAEMPLYAIPAIASDEETVYVSLDRKTSLLQSRYDYDLVRATTGAENVIGRTGLAFDWRGDKVGRDYLSSLPAGPNGTGVTIAILDSGIYDDGPHHEDLRVITDPRQRRILARQNFVSADRLNGDQLNKGYDPVGHGTHVAGIAAGAARECLEEANRVGNIYGGMAFNANLVDLRVIGSDGTGYISDTIAAIDWMIANKDRYKIRVANLSIGAAVTQSYKTDPLCRAVERAVRAGIVCVVAAGNFGKDDAGNPVYGSILAPANDPLVITVGATNSQGSAIRSDDAIASYSSRGPSLIDYTIKPDLVAPGTFIRSIAADGNSLAAAHNLTVYSKANKDVYMWLSGTSMAAPMVAGTAALMLQANPSLTPAMVKSILQFTAQSLPSLAGNDLLINMLSEGAGCLNADAAVRLAKAFVADAHLRLPGSPLLTADANLLGELLYSSRDGAGAFASKIAGEVVTWGDRVIFAEGIAYFYNEGRLSVFLTSGWQVTPDFNLVNGYLTTGGQMLLGGSMLLGGQMLLGGSMLMGGKMFQGGRMLMGGYLWTPTTNEITNPSLAQKTWSKNLLDQGVLGSNSVFNQHSANEQVMVWGDDAAGNAIARITSKRHPLFPRAKKF